MLPPSMRTVAGADQPKPLLLRQDRYPFPYLPPTMNAPVLSEGTMTMQCAFSSRSCGIPLSGVAITSEKTDAASPNRLAGSLSIASNDVVRAKPATITNLIVLCPFCRPHLWRQICSCTVGTISKQPSEPQ